MEDLLVVSLKVPRTFCSTQVLTETENRIICLAIRSILFLFFHYPNPLYLCLMKFICSRIPSFLINFWTFHVFINLWASGLWHPFPSLLVVNLRQLGVHKTTLWAMATKFCLLYVNFIKSFLQVFIFQVHLVETGLEILWKLFFIIFFHFI